ncbi:MAG TPA: hypothetical protein VK029_07600 [Pseudogracilibacillus sp.]|nr:hypothetical protein [Pseudogracilibacillus sp.]
MAKLTEPLSSLLWRIVTLSIPFIIVILIFSAVIVTTITKPIKTLATISITWRHRVVQQKE